MSASATSQTGSNLYFKLSKLAYYLLIGTAIGAIVSVGSTSLYLTAWNDPLCEPLKDTLRCLPSSDPFIGKLAEYCRDTAQLPTCSDSQASSMRNRFLLHSYVPSLLSGSCFAISLAIYFNKRYLQKLRVNPWLRDYVWMATQWTLALILTGILSSVYFIIYTLITQGESACGLIIPNYNNATLPCKPVTGLQTLCTIPTTTPSCSFTDDKILSYQLVLSTILPSIITGGFMFITGAGYFYYYHQTTDANHKHERINICRKRVAPQEVRTELIIKSYLKSPSGQQMLADTTVAVTEQNQVLANGERPATPYEHSVIDTPAPATPKALDGIASGSQNPLFKPKAQRALPATNEHLTEVNRAKMALVIVNPDRSTKSTRSLAAKPVQPAIARAASSGHLSAPH